MFNVKSKMILSQRIIARDNESFFTKLKLKMT